MKYRFLGNTGIQVSEIALGSWLTYGFTSSFETARECFRTAYDCGINLFDTADVYNQGEAERVWGEIMTDYSRPSLVIATKAYFPMSQHVNDQGLSRKHLTESLHGSLKRLKTDYVDLYQCHRYDHNTSLEELITTMTNFIRQGKILYWGTSQWSAVQLVEAIFIAKSMGLEPPVANQPIYNLINRSLEVDVLDVCERYNVGIITFSPLAQSILTGKYTEKNATEDARGFNNKTSQYMKKRMTEDIFKQVDQLKKIAEKLGLTTAQLSLAWCLRQNQLSSVIIGASRSTQIEDNIKASGVLLSDEDLLQIESIFNNQPIDQYTGNPIK